MRPGRAAIGWMSDADAARHLNGGRVDMPLASDQVTRLEGARATLAARLPFSSQRDVLQPLPPELNEHVQRLRTSGMATAFFAEGWSIMLADLKQVVGLQPHVFTDTIQERIGTLSGDDLRALADLALPDKEHLHRHFGESQPEARGQLRNLGADPVRAPPGPRLPSHDHAVLPAGCRVRRSICPT